MATEPRAGVEITAEQADLYLKKFVEIRENLQKEVLPLDVTKFLSPDDKKNVNTFYLSDVNAFIFIRN